MKIPNLKLFNRMKTVVVNKSYYVVPCSYGRVYVIPDVGNCKACNVSRINCIHNAEDVKLLKTALVANTANSIGLNKILFHCSDVSLDAIKLLCEEFHLLEITPIPIGYQDKCQYHCLFYIDNPGYASNGTYKARLKQAGALNRKIEDFNLKGVTCSTINKINGFDLQKARSYKRTYYLKKYLQKHGINIE